MNLHVAPIIIGADRIRIQFDGPVVIRQGLFVPTEIILRDTRL